MTRPIVFVAGKDPTWELAGGHSSYVRTHALAAMRAGYEPHLFCVNDRRGMLETEYGTVHQVWAPGAGLWGRRHRNAPIDMPFLSRAVESFVRRQRGAVPVHSFVHWGSAAAGLARNPHARCLVSMYDTVGNEAAAIQRNVARAHGLRERLDRTFDLAWASTAMGHHERRALGAARQILVNYESVRRLLLQRYPDMAPRILVTPYSVESEMHGDPVCRHARPGPTPHIVSVSRHDPRKGVHVLLRALALLAADGIAFRATLCGPGHLLDAHRRLRDALGLAAFVDLPGYVESPGAVLASADLFVLPSLEEGSGSMSLLEAMRSGLPITATNVDGIPEDVRDGVEALLVPAGDPGALKVAIARALPDPALRKRLGEAAQARFGERFGAAAFVAAMGEVWEG